MRYRRRGGGPACGHRRSGGAEADRVLSGPVRPSLWSRRRNPPQLGAGTDTPRPDRTQLPDHDRFGSRRHAEEAASGRQGSKAGCIRIGLKHYHGRMSRPLGRSALPLPAGPPTMPAA
ncbi:hypothetical protein MTBUT4_100136 [Magnetospirillum sp. UT-4]|nr:hypothetical protein MTBUT4_100136 [Magnetospirillum sp. UT-4]